MNPLTYVDPFHGNGTVDLPRPQGIAATWFFIKAQTGNTHPGACLPFGMVSACAHSGAYVSGYGLNAPNTHGLPARRFDELCASGFAHFHQSGTGSIGTYYNYARVTPLCGGIEKLGSRWPIEDETATPGCYAATLRGTGIRAELAVGRRAALHRYTLPDSGDRRIVVDFGAGGIDFHSMRTVPSEARVQVVSPSEAFGFVRMAGIPLYVWMQARGDVDLCQLWRDGRVIDGDSFSLTPGQELDQASFGPAFSLRDGSACQAELRLGFSLRSEAQARKNMQAEDPWSFDQVAGRASTVWYDHLSRIRVSGGSEVQKEVFYSCLYHALVKPSDFTGECPYWDREAYYVDFATLWDQYKTQQPLMLTVYPETGADAVNGLLAMGDLLGEFPNAIILNKDVSKFDGQARGLTHHVIADAHNRGLRGIDWRDALRLMVADIRKPSNRDFVTDGVAHPYTHTLDLADACFCTARLARQLGEGAIAGEMAELSTRWRNVYDPATALLGAQSTYYEGGLWNYSFRLLHDMAGRIALYPSTARFVEDLDRFFGYGQNPVVQPVDPQDRDYMRWGHSLNRFEGYNNEPDIESPCNYLYAGRPDRTAEVVRAGMKYLYCTGRGGLPGNDDSGGLTSCYVWNALGLFPVSGKPVMLIGSPIFDSAEISVGDTEITIEATDNSEENMYVQGAELNGQPLDRAYLSIDEVLRGGLLRLTMGPEPSAWATVSLPPSYRP